MDNSDFNQEEYLKELFLYVAKLIKQHRLDDASIREKLMQEQNLDEESADLLINLAHQKLNEFEEEKMRQQEKTKKKERKRNLTIAAIIAAVIAVYSIYNLPYFVEMRAYDKAVKENTIWACSEYMMQCPDGKHLDEVMYMRSELDGFQMPYMVEYLKKFPDGKYSAELNQKCDRIWDEEIDKYAERDKQNDDPKAVAYFSELLQYMKSHRINEIVVDVNSNVELTDWTEYSEDVRDLLEAIQDNKAKSLNEYMVSLKENFTKEDQSVLTDILVDGVQESLNKIFDEDFISVVQHSGTSQEAPTLFSETSPETPKLLFDYSIRSQEYEFMGDVRIPEVWTYTSYDIVMNYLIGISINFTAHFTIPGSEVTYDYSEKGEPEDDINDVENIKDGYRVMTSICFAKFSNKMSENLGLAEVYFQGDEE